jgi:hypothetical protein
MFINIRVGKIVLSVSCLLSTGFAFCEESQPEQQFQQAPTLAEFVTKNQQTILDTANGLEVKLRLVKPENIAPEVWREFLVICTQAMQDFDGQVRSKQEWSEMFVRMLKTIADAAAQREVHGGITVNYTK